jgi:DUF4097 and DUF4098 domain-containing protein YvlB
MRTAIAIIAAAATLAHAPALAGQPDQVVRVESTVRVDARVDRQAQQARQRARAERGDEREEQSETISRTLKASELDLSNLSGDITVNLGGNSIQVEAVKVARGRTAEDAREMLGYVSVEIAERGPRAEVKTVYRGHEERNRERRNINVSVRYTVTAPASTKVSARSLSGSIRVTGITGELNVTSLSGDVVVTNGERVMTAKSTSGDVQLDNVRSPIGLDASSVSGTLTVRNSRAPRMRLNTISGNLVIRDAVSERIDAQSISGDVEFVSPLERNGRYDLSSHSGTIRVVPTGNTGFELDASSFSGNIRSELTLTNQSQGAADFGPRGAGGRTRSLSGTFGDGSALLDVSTFSGTVIIGKK